ncbi:MAG: hypothetical protein KUG75_12795 [Pseudomonadales bacterium]|nr:hypothetical protein [Pseudomonadales bacterium]
MRRTDKEEKTYFRSEERFFQINGAWFFAVRKDEHGPFATRKAAVDALTQFVLGVRGNIDLNEISRLDKSAKALSGWDISDY